MKAICFVTLLAAATPSLVLGGPARPEKQWVQRVAFSSGSLSNLSDQPQEKIVGVLSAPAASRVRVALTQAALGTASAVRFVSLKDGQTQTLNAAQLEMWSARSALFNGDSVRLEVILAPGDRDVSVQVEEVLAFSMQIDDVNGADSSASPLAPETLCGGDDRGASNDNRVGRLSGNCTGWLVANGAVLTAGHCFTVAGDILEVNIPASGPDGATVASAVQDQFPVLAGSITRGLDDSVLGNDWGVFRLGPNSLGQFAHQLHGFFRMTRELPAPGGGTRVTGCGVDNSPQGSQPSVCSGDRCGLNAQNQTLQTATGTFTAETGSGSAISLSYAVDTEPANSGSPIIWEGTGFTIGIHTNGGCVENGGANTGTSFELDALENAIAAVPGPNCRYLDPIKAPGGAEDGTVFRPHDTLVEAVNAVPAGGRLSIVAGAYSPGGVPFTKAMTIGAPVGTVTFR